MRPGPCGEADRARPPTIWCRDRSPPRPRPLQPARVPPVRGRARDARRAARGSRRARASRRPALEIRNIETDDEWHRRYAFTIPVVALGDRELELATSPAGLRRLLADVLDAPVDAGSDRVSGDYTFLLAVAAGLISFLSPCVLPLVPAYMGQLTAVAVAAQGDSKHPVALGGRAPRIRLRRGLRRRVHAPRRDGDVRRRPARGLPAGPPDHRRRHPRRHGPEPRRAPADPAPRAHLAAPRRRRVGRAEHDDRGHGARPGRRFHRWATGSAAGSWAAGPGWARRSRSARSSPSGGRRASGRSWAGSSPSRPRRRASSRARCCSSATRWASASRSSSSRRSTTAPGASSGSSSSTGGSSRSSAACSSRRSGSR